MEHHTRKETMFNSDIEEKTVASIALGSIVLWIVLGVGWVMNIVKFVKCDFKAPYKAEIVHGVGLIPVVGAVTGWIDCGK
jgi:hypothetical protein